MGVQLQNYDAVKLPFTERATVHAHYRAPRAVPKRPVTASPSSDRPPADQKKC